MTFERYRFRCPLGHVNIRRHRYRFIKDKYGNVKRQEWDGYYCVTCGDYFKKPIDTMKVSL